MAVTLQLMSILIGFWSRRIFLNHLGAEILGLNTTAGSILGFLNIAELGIGSAIAVTLYKPLAEDDKQTVKEIVALQGWLYKKIATFLIIGSLVLFFFFPLIFGKSELPIWYAYASYAVLLFSSLLSYFVNYKEIVLSADQNEYLVQKSYRATMVVKLAVQALALKFLGNPYLWWLALEVLFTIIASVRLNRAVYSEYPYLAGKVNGISELRKEYPTIVVKVKQLFIHRIGGTVISQVSPLLIYAFSSLSLVAYYGNYLLITNNLTAVMAALFSGLAASIGNMVYEKDDKLTMKIFRELFSSRFLIVSVCCICIWFLADPFLAVWIGDQYLLDKTTLLLVIAIFFIVNIRSVVETFLNAYGLFKDVWSPVAEAAINLGLSLYLGSRFGLNGVLIGVIISQIVIGLIWKPYFLFTQGMEKSVLIYVVLFLKHALASLLTFLFVSTVVARFFTLSYDNFGTFLIEASLLLLLTAIPLFILLYAIEPGMRTFVGRLMKMAGLVKR